MSEESVKVIVRCRPMSKTETANGHFPIVMVENSSNSLSISAPAPSKEDGKSFTFDATFGPESTQDQVYQKAAYSMVEAALNGYNGTIFAYGQTGSGKTHTMMGNLEDEKDYGILPRVISHIFDYISKRGDSGTRYLVRASFFELYNEEVKDLLNPTGNKKLEIKENQNGVYVKDGASFVVKDATELQKLVEQGNTRRSVAATAMNATSSRSHSIFSITIEMADRADDGEERLRMGKLHLVDLAGSERQSKTLATGDRLKEAAKINLSLSCLGNVIAALVDGKINHIPYRDSKLTRLLQDSLGGNSKTLMIAAVSPASYNYDETLSTLRYASRTKLIKNKPKINEDPKDALLREYQDEINRLMEQLNQTDSGGSDLHTYTESQLTQLETDIQKQRVDILSLESDSEENSKELEELQKKSAELQAERQERIALSEKLNQMQSKLLFGGQQMIEKAQKQAIELSIQNAAIEDQKQKEEQLKKELEERKDQYFQMKTSFSSLQEEVNDKTAKLKKLWNVTMRVKAEIKDIQEDIHREREDMLLTIRELMIDIKHKSLIVSSFVPSSYLQWIEANAKYDEHSGSWMIPKENAGGNLIRARYPDRKRGVRHFADDKQELVDRLMYDETYLFPDMLLSYSTFTGKSIASLKSSNSGSRDRVSPYSAGTQETEEKVDAKMKIEKNTKRTDEEFMPVPRGLVNRKYHFA